MKIFLAVLVLAAAVGFVVLPRGGALSGPEVAASERVATISKGGEAVEIADHLDAEAWTVVEFGAVW